MLRMSIPMTIKATASTAEWALWVSAKRRELEWQKTRLAEEAGLARHTIANMEAGKITDRKSRAAVRDAIKRELKRRAASLKELRNGN